MKCDTEYRSAVSKWENLRQYNLFRFVFYKLWNVIQVQRWIEDRRRQLREQEKIDAEVARRVAMEMTDDQRR